MQPSLELGVVYGVEQFEDILDEVIPLWSRHWEVSAVDQEAVLLDPNIAAYRQMASAGILHIVTVRKDGRLIGYYFSVVMKRGLHYGVKEAHCDIYYVDTRDTPMAVLALYRGLFRHMEIEMRKLGVTRLITMTKQHADLSPLWESLGYSPHEYTFYKRLEM